ncbi:unnamed protein product [Dicrocoelium dendriticum]|nr:unnamed protein product [Dicrocoelium dendriticum]
MIIQRLNYNDNLIVETKALTSLLDVLTEFIWRREEPKISQGLSLSSPRKTGPFASKSSPPLRPKKSSKSPSPSRGKSSSSRNSPQMDGVVSPPSSLNGKNSLDAETLRVFDPETMRIRQIVSGYGAENGSVEGPWDYEPGPPFTLTVAGVCDANDMYYFPLQEQIAYLESKLIDLAMRYNNLEDEHRVVRQSHEHLNRTVREANLVARDQVVFENLKLKYQLAATELEDARKLIRELRQLGWENLPQRMLYECKKTHDEMDLSSTCLLTHDKSMFIVHCFQMKENLSK